MVSVDAVRLSSNEISSVNVLINKRQLDYLEEKKLFLTAAEIASKASGSRDLHAYLDSRRDWSPDHRAVVLPKDALEQALRAYAASPAPRPFHTIDATFGDGTNVKARYMHSWPAP